MGSRAQITNDYTLELYNVFHAGQVEQPSVVQKVIGSGKVGVILKDVTLEAHGGELTAILGSKGSGKRALLDVISRRAQGPTRGQISLNGVPMSMRLFQDSCAYVTQTCDLLKGLTVRQTLYYAINLNVSGKISGYVKDTHIKQVMADMALLQVANRSVDDLTFSEYRRLVIGTYLIRDPVVVLLDEPTADLDPLNTYFLISILSNHAKKYNRIVIMTTEKPRSDIFPFLDRVTYLCLGDVVYSGSTRMMLDYFRTIGFPCPELENPLMYYLCLSTVDRRTRDRFVESSNQIAVLVDKFKTEGRPFDKYGAALGDVEPVEVQHRIPLTAYGKPSPFTNLYQLMKRELKLNFGCQLDCRKQAFLRLLLLPLFYFLLWIFYFGMEKYQHTFLTRNGLLFNSLAGVCFLSIVSTVGTYPSLRTRYYQETRDGVYGGTLFILSHSLVSIPLSILTVFPASAILYWGLQMTPDALQWFLFASVLWSVYVFMEQQTMTVLMAVKSSYKAAILSIYLGIIYIVLGSAMTRAIPGMPDWLYYISYVVQPRYAGAFLNEQQFKGNMFDNLPALNGSSVITCPLNTTQSNYGCRYTSGTHYLMERYYHNTIKLYSEDLELMRNFGLSFVFYGAMFITNLVLHSVPLPAFIKDKFRD